MQSPRIYNPNKKKESNGIVKTLEDKKVLRQGKGFGRESIAEHAVRLDDVAFRVDVHLGHGVVVLHVGFADGSAVLDGFDALLDAVGLHRSGVDRGLRDPHDGEAGDVGLGRSV